MVHETPFAVCAKRRVSGVVQGGVATDWGASPEKFLAALLSEGAAITRYERALPSMDEVFVRVVKES